MVRGNSHGIGKRRLSSWSLPVTYRPRMEDHCGKGDTLFHLGTLGLSSFAIELDVLDLRAPYA